MIVQKIRPFILLAALFMGAGSLPIQAASVAEKIEQLGEIRNLKVNAIRVVRRNDFLNIQAEILNTSNNNQELYYRFKWLDDSGFTVGGEETWKPVLIYGGQKKLLESVAPVTAATDFRIEMQSPNNKGVSSERSNSSDSSN